MRRSGLAALLALSACGPEAAVWVRIEAPLSVPGECDAVELTAVRLSDGTQIYTARHDLAAGPTRFPLELALSTDNPSNLGEQTVELEVRALKGQDLAKPWATAKQRFDLKRRQWTQATVALCDCP